MDKKKIFSTPQIFFLVISIILSILIVVYFTQIKRDLQLFKKIDPYWLILALAGQACTYLFGALVYTQLIKAFNIHIHNKTWKLFQVSIVTLFLNQTVPSAGLSGNAFFFDFLRKKNVPAHQTVTLISVELLSFYAAMELIILFTLLMGLTMLKLTSTHFIVLGVGFIVYFLFGLGVQFLSKRKTIGKLTKKMQSVKIFRKLIEKAKKSMQTTLSVKKVDSPVQFFRQHKWAVTRATLLQICLFLADAFTIYALSRGIGVPFAILKIPVALILTRIISLLPISPGALIIFEGGMTYFLTSLGMEVGPAAIVTIAFRVLSFWLPIVLGFVLYKKLQNE